MKLIDTDELCDCPCKHKYGKDFGFDCTDDYCGYCGTDMDS